MKPTSPTSRGPDLRDYLAILRARNWSIFLVAALVITAAVLYTARLTPLYQSSAQVLVKPVVSQGSTTGATTPLLMETEAAIGGSSDVAALASKERGEDVSSLGSVSVTAVTDTQILVFSATSTSPKNAQRVAQAYAEAYITFRRDQVVKDLTSASESISKQLNDLRNQLGRVQAQLLSESNETKAQLLQTKANSYSTRIAILEQQLAATTPPDSLRVAQVLQSAQLPSAPSSPNYSKNIALGVLVGLILGLSTALLRDRLDDRVRGRADLEEAIGDPVLAVVPAIRAWKKRSKPFVVTLSNTRSVAAEAYRTLRTGILFAASQRNMQVIMITSANAQEGKTATAANLGVVLAQAGKRAIVVTADLRRPRLESFFDRRPRTGLSNVLAGEIPLDEAIIETGVPGLRCLPSGSLPGNPAEMLGSEAMDKLIGELRERADWVILDTTPVLAAADALTLVPRVDGVLLVVDATKTAVAVVSHTREQLAQVAAPVIGGVLNNFVGSKGSTYRAENAGYAPAAVTSPSESRTFSRRRERERA